jgi:acyl carrier protein
MSDTLTELKQLIQTKVDVDVATLDNDKPLAEYGLDSLTLVELMFSIEDHFNVVFPDSAPNLDTLSGISALVDQLRPVPA